MHILIRGTYLSNKSHLTTNKYRTFQANTINIVLFFINLFIWFVFMAYQPL